MDSAAYKLGFAIKMAELSKSALSQEARTALLSYSAEEDRKLGYRPKTVRLKPNTFREALSQTKQRAKDYMGSFGRGLASTAGITGLRAAQSGVGLTLWVPEMVDSALFGKLMGIDEGRGLLGRKLGKFNRAIDSRVHSLRNWSDRYDYAHDVGSGFNHFMNGTLADASGRFLGGGGVGGIFGKSIGRKLLGTTFGALSAGMALGPGSDRELRERENMIRGLHPRDWARVDATSTATNQAEYRRYHTPYIPNLPTSTSGYINVPSRWWFTPGGEPIQTRDFGT